MAALVCESQRQLVYSLLRGISRMAVKPVLPEKQEPQEWLLEIKGSVSEGISTMILLNSEYASPLSGIPPMALRGDQEPPYRGMLATR